MYIIVCTIVTEGVTLVSKVRLPSSKDPVISWLSIDIIGALYPQINYTYVYIYIYIYISIYI